MERLSSIPAEDSDEDFEVLGKLDLVKGMLDLKEENKRLSDQVSTLSQQVSSVEEECKRSMRDRIDAIEGRLNEAQVLSLLCMYVCC